MGIEILFTRLGQTEIKTLFTDGSGLMGIGTLLTGLGLPTVRD